MIEGFILLAIAGLNAFTAYLGYRANAMATKIHAVTANTNANMHLLETSTNSKMDILLAKTAKDSLHEGELKGRAEAAAERNAEEDRNKNLKK